MNTDNPFGEEIDDDGLPKYSPDRKNIVAYHMYKPGMTDKLPDPEESHTPFFRTPSYYEEKVRRERQVQAGLNPKVEAEQERIEPVKPESSDFFRKYPIRGNEPDFDKPAFRVPSTGQKPFVPDTNAPDGQMGQAGQKEKEVAFGQQEGKGQNKEDSSSDGNAFGREVLGRIFGGMKPVVPNGGLDGGLQKQPFSGSDRMGEPQQYASPEQPVSPEKPDTPEKGLDGSGQVSPSASRTLLFELNRPMPLPVQTDQSGNTLSSSLVDRASRAIQPIPDSPDMSPQEADLRNAFAYRTLELIFNEQNKNEEPKRSGTVPLFFRSEASLKNGVVSSGGMEPVPVQNAVYPAREVAPGWMNGDASQANSQKEAGASPDGDFSPDGLEAPSAGRPNKPFRSVFVKDNANNPGFVPMQVAILSPGQLAIPKGRREVTPEMTNGINSDLTRLNRGWAIGINFTVLSRLEGGSSPYANLPVARNELELERREKLEAMKMGELPPQRKWANNSGVTIGSGFDLGQTSVEEMRGLGFPESLVEKCAPYVGKRRLDADDLLRKRPLVLSNAEIDLVNQTVMMHKAQKSIQDWDSRIAALKKTNPNAPFFHEMTSAQQTIVFSRYYHQGPGWIGRTVNRPMFEAMKRNDWATVNRQLEGLSNRSGPKWLRDRFRKELWFLNGKY